MTKETILIFHRSRNSNKEALTNQQAFLEEYRKQLNPAIIFDYESGNYHHAKEISEYIRKDFINRIGLKNVITIINNPISFENYDLYTYFSGLECMEVAEIYLMDNEGKLYKEVELQKLN